MQQISFGVLPILRTNGNPCWSPKKYHNWEMSVSRWLSQLMPWAVDRSVSFMVNRQCSSHTLLTHFAGKYSATFQYLGAPEMGHLLWWALDVWKYHCSIMFWRYVNHLQTNCHHWAWYRPQREALAECLLIGLIWFWCCALHAPDGTISTLVFAGYMIKPVESHLDNDINSMHSVVQSSCDTGCIIQLLYHRLSMPYCLLQ